MADSTQRQYDLRTVALAEIKPNPIALRQVNRDSERYLNIVASVGEQGILNPILVRWHVDPEDKNTGWFELIDGLHRFSAAKDAGLESVPVYVRDMNDDTVLEAQIIANLHKQETSPIEYTKQLQEILKRNPFMTESELAKKLGVSPQWISQRLSLHKIENEKIQEAINSGDVTLTNAYALAKLPPDEQLGFFQSAMEKSPEEFAPTVAARVKELKDERRKGKTPVEESEFTPVQFMRKPVEVKTELVKREMVDTVLSAAKATTAQEGFFAALEWVLHVDPESLAEQQAKFEEDKQKRIALKAQKKSAAEAKRAKEYREKALAAEQEAAKANEVLAGAE